MNRNAFRYFISVIEAGSIREAVDQVGVAQSSVSRQIMQLEEELGVRLLDRLSHGVSLTQAGEIFARHAREAMARVERLQSEISMLQGVREGTVRIAIVDSFTDQFLPSCIRAFRSRYPGINFEVLVGPTERVLRHVRERRADFGLAYNLPYENDIRINLALNDRIVALVSPDHKLAGREHISLTDLSEVPLALPRLNSPVRQLIDAEVKYCNVILKPKVESDSVSFRIGLAATSDVVTLCAEIAGVHAVAKNRLVAVPLRAKRFNEGRIEVFSIVGRPLTVAAEAFSRLLQDRLQSRSSGDTILEGEKITH